MFLDFEIQRCTRECAASGRKLEPGETCYSVLEADGAEVVRKDFASEVWQGPPEKAFAWWKSQIPDSSATKAKLAPNEVLLELFDQLVDHPQDADMRYVLALILIRRRVFRQEESADVPRRPADSADGETLSVHCPKRDESYMLRVVTPEGERIDQIQDHLTNLLYAEAA